MHLQLPGCALLLSNTTYLIITESLSTMSRFIHPPAATGISLSPHMKSLVFGSSHFYNVFSVLSSLSAHLCPLFPQLLNKFPNPPPGNSTQRNFIQFHSFATFISFAFPFQFFSSSSYTYFRCSRTPANPLCRLQTLQTRQQHHRLTLALINNRAKEDYYTQLMSSKFSHLHII